MPYIDCCTTRIIYVNENTATSNLSTLKDMCCTFLKSILQSHLAVLLELHLAISFAVLQIEDKKKKPDEFGNLQFELLCKASRSQQKHITDNINKTLVIWNQC